MNREPARFNLVYDGESGRGKVLHSRGLCDHTTGCVPATPDEVRTLRRCEQCENEAEDRLLPVEPAPVAVACPSCFMVSPCDCEDER